MTSVASGPEIRVPNANISGEALVHVAVRARPLIPNEPGQPLPDLETGTQFSLLEVKERETPIGIKRTEKRYTYTFEHVFDPSATTPQVFETLVNPLMDEFEQGRPTCAFCYGFTGCGKSYTIYGNGESHGLVDHAAERLLAQLPDIPGATGYIRVSIYEVIGKACSDLLNNGEPVFVRSAASGSVHPRGVSRHHVNTLEDLARLIRVGREARKVGSSTVHDESSRSHAVVEFDVVTDAIMEAEMAVMEAERIKMEKANARDDAIKAEIAAAYERDGPAALAPGTEMFEKSQMLGQAFSDKLSGVAEAREKLQKLLDESPPVVRGKLAFIDLAGNDWEKGTDTVDAKDRATSAQINTSLLAVKECLRSLALGKNRVPYRNSTLTHLMSGFFVPGARLLMICAVTSSNDERLVRQTLNSLAYANLLGQTKRVERRIPSVSKSSKTK